MSSFSPSLFSLLTRATLLLLVSTPLGLSAQFEAAPMGYPHTGGWSNPASLPFPGGHLIFPGLSGLSISAFHSGPTHGQVVSDAGAVDIEGFVERLDLVEHEVLDLEVPILGFGFRSRSHSGSDWAFSYSTSAQIEQRVSYPKGLLELAWRGNAHPDMIGQRLSLDGFGVYAQTYLDHAVTASVDLSQRRLRLGLGAHYLMGLGAVNTLTSRAGWTTDPLDYAWDFDGSLDIRSAGVPLYVEGADSLNFDALDDFNPMESPIASGVSVDLGLLWDFAPKWQFDAAATGLGSIRWDNHATAIRLDPQSFRFEGLDLLQVLEDSSATSTTDQFLDSLALSWTPDLAGDATFTSAPIGRLHAAVHYAPGERSTISAFVARKTVWRAHFYSIGAAGDFRVSDHFSLHLSGQFFDSEQWLLGGGFSVRAGPVRWSLSTTNALPAFAPLDRGAVQVSTRINFEWGGKKLDKESQSNKKAL